LIWPLSVYTCPPLTLSEFAATGVGLPQAAESLISRLAAPLGAGVAGSMAKQVLGSVQPVVPAEKSPFTSRLEPNDQPTSEAVKPPSTTAWAKAGDPRISERVYSISTKTEHLANDVVVNDGIANDV